MLIILAGKLTDYFIIHSEIKGTLRREYEITLSQNDL